MTPSKVDADLVLDVAKLIAPDWWSEHIPDDEVRYPLNNYPGQHLEYREDAMRKAAAIVALCKGTSP